MMRRKVMGVCFGLGMVLALVCWAQTRVWQSKIQHRATTAAFADTDIEAGANSRFAGDNDLVGIEVTDLGPVPGGNEAEVRLIFDPVGGVADMGDITAVVFVSTDRTDSYVVSYQDPDPVSAPAPGGGEINNSIEYAGASAAFSDGEVEAFLDERFDANVEISDVNAIVTGSDETGTTVKITMESTSPAPGKGDVTARVLVSGGVGTVTQVTEE